MSGSNVYTVGSALRQAENDDLSVSLLVGGEWFSGAVAGLDGDGVMLSSVESDVLVRLTAISAVRMGQASAAVAPAPAPVAPVALAPVVEPVVEPVAVEEPVAEAVEPIQSGKPEPLVVAELEQVAACDPVLAAAEEILEEAHLSSASVQSDDWRAMLVSIREEARPVVETEKRRAWKLAR
ncbi:MAG: hypothetical protein QM714_18985 [Nocardioides sp.]|uniref:hypothetical protein n=1 Tax=Nocardioides sp. TaxID=35761 RepID=UPI0039E5C56A